MAEGRHRTSSRRKPAIIVISTVVVVGLAVGGLLLMGGSKAVKRIITAIDEGPDMTVPPFDFRVTKAVPVATVPDVEKKVLKAAAKKAASEAKKMLDELFTEAFLDPANWREGTYDNVWGMFRGGATAAAQKDAKALTLGATAGDTYELVEPAKSKVKFKVLLDDKNQPNTVVAIVRFRAKAHASDGTTTVVVSRGQLILTKDGGWKVLSYEVSRNDQIKQPEPSPTVSGSATGSVTASPTGTA